MWFSRNHEHLKIASINVYSIGLMLLIVLIYGMEGANAEDKVETILLLNSADKVYEDSAATFSGRLVRADNGVGIAKATILIKNAGTSSIDEIITYGVTDDEGKFSIEWIVKSPKDSLMVYASYMGSSNYFSSQSERYSIEIEKTNLDVYTNKEVYESDDKLVISGSGKPNDVISIFVTTTQSVVLATQIVTDQTGKITATLLKWDNTYNDGIYYIHVRSTTDITSDEKITVYFYKKEVIQEEPTSTETVIALNPLRSNIIFNEYVAFTGRLTTVDESPVKEAIVLIKYKNSEEEGVLARGTTSEDGKFYIVWQNLLETPVDLLAVYANFEGTDDLLPSQSEQRELKFKPRNLTLELNKSRFVTNEPLIVSGTGPTMEWLRIEVFGSICYSLVSKDVFVDNNENYEVMVMKWVRPSLVTPEGEYTVNVQTKNLPVLSVSKIINFEEPKPLSEYKVVGYILYKDSNDETFPVGGAKVRLSGPYGEVESYTDTTGKYVFNDLHSITKNLGNVFSLVVELDGKYFRILDASKSDEVIRKRTTSIRFDGGLHDVNIEPVVFSDKKEVAAARIFTMHHEIMMFYRDVLGLQLEKIDVEIFSKETSTGKYGYETNGEQPKIWVSGRASNPGNPETWDTLAHEYTHYVQDLYISIDHYNSMNHGGFNNPTTADSMVEGFANFMSAVIAQHYNKEQAGKFLRYNLEFNYKVNSPDSLSEELSIAGIFWDIYDSSGNDDDTISLSIKDIWNIMSNKYYFPSYNEHSGIDAGNRYIYYLKDLHYILTQFSGTLTDDIEELFTNHGIINGFTDPTRPGRL